MKLLHIVGKKNQGKTALVVALVGTLTARGLRVATLKHCHKDHELDTPGKDSHEHRAAGAVVVAAVTPALTAVFKQRDPATDLYECLRSDFADCDIVLVEGYAQGPGPKVEVWRAENDKTPLAAERDDIAAIATNDAQTLAVHCPAIRTLPLDDLAALADYILAAAEDY